MLVGGEARASQACTASKSVAWRLTCGLLDPLRGLVVLVDHPAEYLPPLDRQVQRNADLVVLVGWSLLTGLMRAVPVEMAGVLVQDRAQVLLAVDQHPVSALGSRGAYPSLGVAVRPRGPRRGLHYRRPRYH